MRKLAIATFMTLDSVMQSPAGPGEDTSGNFEKGGWFVPFWDDVLAKSMESIFAKNPDMLLGRKTYEIMAAYWPHHEEEGAEINAARKYVASNTLDTVEWNNSVLLKGDVPTEVARLKEEDGPEIQVHGSSDLIQTLLKHNLVDVMYLKIFPVTIGEGKRLFGKGTSASTFKMVESEISPSGVIVATYENTGKLDIGEIT